LLGDYQRFDRTSGNTQRPFVTSQKNGILDDTAVNTSKVAVLVVLQNIPRSVPEWLWLEISYQISKFLYDQNLFKPLKLKQHW
jgi:hypothetical protein